MIPQYSTAPTYYKATLVLKGWPGEVRPNPDEEALQLVSLPGGSSDGGIELLCEAPTDETVPVLVEPYEFLETRYNEKKARHAKYSLEWDRLIVEPIERERARIFREEAH
jgi:hypothetical protein